MKKIIQITLVAVGLSLMTSCTTIGVERPYVVVPNLNEKLTIGPKLTGQACRKSYPLGFYSTDYKGYASVTGIAVLNSGRVEGPPVISEILTIYNFFFKIASFGYIDFSKSARDINELDPTYRAALYDALSKDKSSDLLLDPVYTIDQQGGLFVTKKCFGVTARGVTVN
jgi:hypothetical protein